MSKSLTAPAIFRRRVTAFVILAGGTMLTSHALASVPNGSWTLWAGPANGVPYASFPTLSYSPETNTLFYSSRFAPSPTDTLGSVWTCDLNVATPSFTKLPQTGLILPTPKPGNSRINVFSMTTDSAGEPIIGTGAPGNTDPNQTSQTKLFRFDKTSNQWVAPPVTAIAGQNLPTIQPTNIMYQLTRGADGTIWGGGQWSKTYRSTDDGKTFTVFDEAQILFKNYPNYYKLNYPLGAGSDGAVYAVRVAPNGYVYEGNETGGVIYSPDNGVSWQPLDYDSTNPNSTMARASNVGNVAGLGFTKDGKVVVQGAPSPVQNPAPDSTHLYLFDPVNHTSQVCLGIPDYFFGSQDVHTIMTAPDGTLFINSGRNTVSNGQPVFGGVLTSTDGLNWSMFNTGLTSVAGADYRSAGPDSMVIIGSDVFMSTTDGKIWKYTTTPVTFNSTQHLTGLTILAGDTVNVTGGGNGHRSVLFTPSVSILGTLDLKDNDLVVQSATALQTVTTLLQQGLTGTGNGILSSAAANDPTGLTTLGVVQNSVVNGSPLFAALDGAAVNANDILVKFTYYGDASLNGIVDGNDYTLIDNGFQTTAKGWRNGDFNYDGLVDGSDYSLIDNAYNSQTITLAASSAISSSEIAPATVPEPASAALCAALFSICRFRSRPSRLTSRKQEMDSAH